MNLWMLQLIYDLQRFFAFESINFVLLPNEAKVVQCFSERFHLPDGDAVFLTKWCFCIFKLQKHDFLHPQLICFLPNGDIVFWGFCIHYKNLAFCTYSNQIKSVFSKCHFFIPQIDMGCVLCFPLQMKILCCEGCEGAAMHCNWLQRAAARRNIKGNERGYCDAIALH